MSDPLSSLILLDDKSSTLPEEYKTLYDELLINRPKVKFVTLIGCQTSPKISKLSIDLRLTDRSLKLVQLKSRTTPKETL